MLDKPPITSIRELNIGNLLRVNGKTALIIETRQGPELVGILDRTTICLYVVDNKNPLRQNGAGYIYDGLSVEISKPEIDDKSPGAQFYHRVAEELRNIVAERKRNEQDDKTPG